MENKYRETKLDDRSSKKKGTCYGCGHKKCFTHIVYADTYEIVAEHVGRCDRENNCGYFYSYADYLKEQGIEPGKREDRKRYIPKPAPVPPPSFMSHEIFTKSLSNYDRNNLYSAFAARFGGDATDYLFSLYHVGTSKLFGNSAAFWQKDIQGRNRACKIMLYDAETMRRVRKPYDMVMWLHALKSSDGSPMFPGYNLQQCFFGEHLLITNYYKKPVALVESEKTALICSLYMPQFIWLATGGSNGCKWTETAVNKALRGFAVYLFPDAGYSNPKQQVKAFDKWSEKAKEMLRCGVNVVAVSDFLEKNLTPEEWAQGLDMGDILIRESHIDYLRKSFMQAYSKPMSEAQQLDEWKGYKERGLPVAEMKQMLQTIEQGQEIAA